MHDEFIITWKDLRSDWLCWLGQPMLFDGGLYVNRTLDEHNENNLHRKKKI